MLEKPREIQFVLTRYLKKLGALLSVSGCLLLGEGRLSACPDQDIENDASQLNKRPFKANSYTFCKKQKRDYDDQLYKLTRESDYVTGEECARVGWVKDLDSYYASKDPSKVVQVPADIHFDLQDIGDFIKGCSAYQDSYGLRSQKNILVPYVSYVINDGHQRKFIKGDYLKIPMGDKDSRPLFFISGMSDWNVQTSYNKHSKSFYFYDSDTYPAMQAMGGQYLGKKTGQNFSDDSKSEKHTERWFHEIINFFPKSVINPLNICQTKPKKLYAIIIDMYSIWDACPDCQKRFRQEFFKGTILKKIESTIKEKGIQLPRNGLKVVYRMSSQQKYGSRAITDETISQAGGGDDPEKGFDIKAINAAQVTIATRVPSQKPLGWMRAYNSIRKREEYSQQYTLEKRSTF